MSEETTRKFNGHSFEERVLAEFVALNQRLTMLEERVDARLREIRPIWEGVKAQLDRVESKLDVVAADLLEIRTDYALLGKRVVRLEERERPPAI